MSTAAQASAGEKLLMQCSFVESASVSFGFSSIYTIKGSLKELSLNGPEHFYEVDGPAHVSIDDTASTNFPGKHIANTTANVENHTDSDNVLIDVTSTEESGAGAFRIEVFPGKSNTPNPYYKAYKTDTLNGIGISGACYKVDPQLVEQN